MSHRRENVYFERLVEHLQEREWADVQIVNLTHMIGRSALLSCEGVLRVMEYQQQVDRANEQQRFEDSVAAFEQVFEGGAGDYQLPGQEGEALPRGWLHQRFFEVD